MMQVGDDRRNYQMLDEQIKVITSVCKKLNQDIEVFSIYNYNLIVLFLYFIEMYKFRRLIAN
jgi:hypothetical protein